MEWLCIGALTRQAEIATLIAVWPHEEEKSLEYFHVPSHAPLKRPFSELSSECLVFIHSVFLFPLPPSLSSFS